MYLEIIMLSEVRERQIRDIIHIWNLIFKSDSNEFIHKTETYFQIQKKKKGFQRGNVRELRINIHVLLYVRQPTGTYCIAQGTLLNFL